MRTPGIVLALAACLLDCNSNRGTEATVKSNTGFLFLPNGKPAVNARVRLFPVGHLAGSSADVFTTNTDAAGKYTVGAIANGNYNILGDLDQQYSFHDSVAIGEGANGLPKDTLQAPGSISGVVGLQPYDDPRTVTVQVFGTNSFTNVDSNGRFTLANLGAGSYSLRIATTLADYTPLISDFKVNAGAGETWPDTGWLPFTGIPAVHGLAASFDTATGIAHVTWKGTDLKAQYEFQIFRDMADAANLSSASVARTRDTSWFDTLYRGDSSLFGPVEGPIRYRVRVLTMTEKAGPVFGFAEIRAAPASWIRTAVQVLLAGKSEWTVTVGDTAAILLTWGNPTRRIRKIEWLDGDGGILRSFTPGAKIGVDSFAYVAGPNPSESNMSVRIEDEAGLSLRTFLKVRVVDDVPVLRLAASKVESKIGDTIHIQSESADRGRIIRREWDIGHTGTYLEASGTDTLVRMPAARPLGGKLVCGMRITDEDGNSDSALVEIRFIPWKKAASLPYGLFDGAAAVLDGKLYVAGGVREISNFKPLPPTAGLAVYDPAIDSWTRLKDMPTPRSRLGLVASGGRLYAVGGEQKIISVIGSQNTLTYLNDLEEYLPDQDQWQVLPAMPSRMHGAGVAALGEEIFVIPASQTQGEDPLSVGGVRFPDDIVSVYSPASLKWKSVPFTVQNNTIWPRGATFGYAVGIMGDKVQIIGGKRMYPVLTTMQIVAEYNLRTGLETRNRSPDESRWAGPAAAAKGPRVYIPGSGQSGNEVMVYDAEEQIWYWKSKAPMTRLGGQAVAELDGAIYVIGGLDRSNHCTADVEVYYPSQDTLQAFFH